MPRISQKNKRFRTKEEIAHDVAEILKGDFHYGTKFAVLSEVVWVWSEFYGKYQGCPWWSVEASKQKEEKNIHEHVIPKKVLIQALFSMDKPNEREVYDYLERHCIGVVVTKEEDKRLRDLKLGSKMPEDWNGEDVWARYQLAGIEAHQDGGINSVPLRSTT